MNWNERLNWPSGINIATSAAGEAEGIFSGAPLPLARLPPSMLKWRFQVAASFVVFGGALYELVG